MGLRRVSSVHYWLRSTVGFSPLLAFGALAGNLQAFSVGSHRHMDNIAVEDLTCQQFLRQGITDGLLDEAAQRARTIGGS